jgi:ubiquinone/menaquinone biosynthesis C-methylase UbiE
MLYSEAMQRIPEPELMTEEEQARAYAEADFDEPHAMFVRLCDEAWGNRRLAGRVIDLGCGPADITVRFAERFPETVIDAVDGSGAMLEYARRRVRRHGLDARIRLVNGRLPDVTLPSAVYDAVISNSLLHHLAVPAVLWQAIKGCARPGAMIFIMDLMRPDDESGAQALVDRYAAQAPPVLRHDFHASLFAAYRPDEVRRQLEAADLGRLEVSIVSDRHITVSGRLPDRVVHVSHVLAGQGTGSG